MMDVKIKSHRKIYKVTQYNQKLIWNSLKLKWNHRVQPTAVVALKFVRNDNKKRYDFCHVQWLAIFFTKTSLYL